MPHLKPSRHAAGLAVVLAIGAFLRYRGLNWDEGRWVHPDERFLLMVDMALQGVRNLGAYFDTATSTLNPHNRGFNFYVYGTLPLFLTHWLRVVLEPVTHWNGHVIARGIAATAGMATLVFTYLLGRWCYGKRIALIGTGFLALCVLPIQLSHFFTVDPYAALFTTMALYFAVRFLSPDRPLDGEVPAGQHLALRRRAVWTVATGVAIGLAMASKVSTAVIALAAIEVVCLVFWRYPGMRLRLRFAHTQNYLCVAGLVAFVVFRIFQPYAFSGPGFFGLLPNQKWIANLEELSRLARPTTDFPPGVQWMDRSRWFGWVNLTTWGMGLPLGLLAWAGFAWAGWELARRHRLVHLLPWSWTAVYFLFLGVINRIPTVRYQLPVYPTLCLFAAWAVVKLRDASDARVRVAGTAIGGIVAVLAVLWAFAFSGIYVRPLTRNAASRWMFANIPSGSHIANESWDDGLPLPVDGKNPYGGMYVGHTFEMYYPDDSVKVARLTETLKATDYIALSSGRAWGTLTRLPRQYPIVEAYYRNLMGCPDAIDVVSCYRRAELGMFTGRLGFELVHVATSYPSLGPLRINDQYAEEAFTVYDHPKVLIFRKRSDFSGQAVASILEAALSGRR